MCRQKNAATAEKSEIFIIVYVQKDTMSDIIDLKQNARQQDVGLAPAHDKISTQAMISRDSIFMRQA